ncbi:helix-turn-helix domain-containing protein [Vibrio fluvialis]|nr:winged helix-turn-helix domain-containing protein [Vibrio fluvialis]
MTVSTKSLQSYQRRLLIAHLINKGINTVPKLVKEIGIQRRTAQDTIAALSAIEIQCEFVGANRNGYYRIKDWGGTDPRWVAEQEERFKQSLNYVQHI